MSPFLDHGVPLARVAQESGIALRTLWYWVSNYEKEGLRGLARKGREDKGARRKLAPELKTLIEGLLLRRPAPSITNVHKQIAEVCLRHGWECPSYWIIYDVARHIPGVLKTLALEGEKSYEQLFEIIIRRESHTANEIWQVDHTPMDIVIKDDDGTVRRPVLTAVLDDFSRAVAGYYIAFEPPSSVRVALALRQAIWRKSDSQWQICGIPDKLYSDRGSDFMSQHIEQVAANLKIELINTRPYKPRGKGKVERFFDTVNTMFLSRLPGYCPAGHKQNTASLGLADLNARFHSWLMTEYHQREHSETKQPPLQKWESAAFLPRLPDSLEQLDLLLLTVAKPRKVQRDGIRFQGFRYFDCTLAGYVAEEVTIRFDPRDLAEIFVYSNDRLVCKAICAELSDKIVSLKDVIKTRKDRKRELKELLADRAACVKRHVTSFNTSTSKPRTTDRSVPVQKIKRYANE